MDEWKNELFEKNNWRNYSREVFDVNKRFNIIGVCILYLYYMVDIIDKFVKIEVMVNRGDYFVINRLR